PDVGPPFADAPDGGGEMHDGVRFQRNRSVSGDPVRDELDAARNLLARLHLGVAHLSLLTIDAAAFGETVLRLELGEVLRDHIADADTRVALFARFGQIDHVAVERHAPALQHQHRHQRRRGVVLVVDRTAAVHPAAVARRAEGRELPLRGVDAYGIRVAHDQQRTLRAVSVQTSEHVRPVWFEREQLRGDAVVVEDFLYVLRRRPFLRGRVDANERLKMTHRLLFDVLPVEGRAGA